MPETIHVIDSSALINLKKEIPAARQWDFFATVDAPEPRFRIPWHDWRPYGAILLSGDRGEGRTLGDIAVYDAPPRDLRAAP